MCCKAAGREGPYSVCFPFVLKGRVLGVHRRKRGMGEMSGEGNVRSNIFLWHFMF